MVPLILVIWVTAIAASSPLRFGDEDFWDTAIYGQDDYDYDHFGYGIRQAVVLEFEYNQALTWEKEHPYMDVEWDNNSRS